MSKFQFKAVSKCHVFINYLDENILQEHYNLSAEGERKPGNAITVHIL